MIKNILLTAVIILAVITFFGCEGKKGETDGTGEDVTTDSTSGEDNEVEANTIQDLKGTWTGTFDGRATTLTITDQTDRSFSGKLSIKYRETINQEVKGSFSPKSRRLTMSDQIHSKYMGKYDGKISDDWKNISGTFTKNRNGEKTTFTLNLN